MTPDANALDVDLVRRDARALMRFDSNPGIRDFAGNVLSLLDRLDALEAEVEKLKAVADAVPAVIAEADRETVSFQTLRRALAALAPSDSSAKEKA